MPPIDDKRAPKIARTVMSPEVNTSPEKTPCVNDFDSTRYAIYPGKRANAHG